MLLAFSMVAEVELDSREGVPLPKPELRALAGASATKVKIQDAGFFYGKFRALRGVNLEVPERRVTALIGPSGCGKSTLLRMLNRMYDMVPGSRAEGSVVIDGENVLTTGHLLELRQRVGMVFQRPSPFPMSIRDNVAFAPQLLGWPRKRIESAVRESLDGAALWDEVKDRLNEAATGLSGGQQQRLSIARCLAVEPEVIRTGRTICFAQSLIKADDVVIARANGTFRVVPKPATSENLVSEPDGSR